MIQRRSSSVRRLTSLLAFAFTMLPFLWFASCGKSKGAERRYELRGTVVSVDRAQGSVVVDHEEIPNFMEAMRMPFSIPDRDEIQIVETGDRLQATLVVTDRGYWLENLIISKEAGAAPAGASRSLEPKEGAEVPEFSLVNQDGRRISIRQQRGRAVLVTFIYTRCPLADQCPLMSGNFAEINRELEKDAALGSRTHLLSVTLDPEYDRPQVLRSYGAGHTEKYSEEKFDRWEFATGDPLEIRRMAEFFGLVYVSENGQITHSLRTAIISPEGKLYKVYRGNEWKPAEVLRDLRTLLS